MCPPTISLDEQPTTNTSPFFQLCLFQQLFHCLPGFRLDLLFECVCHINYLVSIGCRDDPMFCILLGPSVYNNFSGMSRAPLAGELAREA